MFSIFILALSLSLDSFIAGVSYGLRKVKIPLLSKLIICLFSIIYCAAALKIGSLLSNLFPPYIAKLFGIGILTFMGIWIIFHTLTNTDENREKEEVKNQDRFKEKTLLKFGIKSLGITVQVIKNPVRGDIDKSGSIDILESLLLGFALSVDAIGAGVGSALAGFNSSAIPFIVGIFQFLSLYVGTFVGNRFSCLEKINRKAIPIFSGVLFILLALLRIY